MIEENVLTKNLFDKFKDNEIIINYKITRSKSSACMRYFNMNIFIFEPCFIFEISIVQGPVVWKLKRISLTKFNASTENINFEMLKKSL